MRRKAQEEREMSLDTANRVIAILSTHGGRDKIAKVFHYGARIAVWYYTSKGLTKRAESTENFRQAIGQSRRVGRFFSSVGSVPSILATIEALKDKSQPPSETAMNAGLLVAHCCDCLYYISDNLTFAAGYNFITLPDKTAEFLDNVVGCYTWLVSVLVWIVWSVKRYFFLQNEIKRVKRSPAKTPEDREKERSLIAESNSTLHLGISLLCDLQLAIFFIKGYWSSQMVGVFGVCGGLLGLYESF